MKHRDERPTLQAVIARARAKWAAKMAVGGTALAVAVGAVTFAIGALVIGAVAADVGISHGWFKSKQAEPETSQQQKTSQDQSTGGDSSKGAKKSQVDSYSDSWSDPEADNVINFDDLFDPSGSKDDGDGSSGTSVEQGEGDESSQGGDWTKAYK
ncbi:hypothetical protein H7U32_05055 [Bifidobacterium pullorum subsp. saeculare]|uniref:Uncharacterized protein n=1 Tax=Bifidobacterium pullorum subsp. saeculare TaxID=78257 RepID=A0A939B8A0_9BIFI|nr:hypothetical protein [Bifidobacterium pullorum]MBM6699692.1 hypothetical protein [Bifidobacterium pullorum subsp. saeculare]